LRRGVAAVVGRLLDPARSLGRGDPPGKTADRAAAGARGGGTPGADAAARITARRAHLASRRAGPAGRPGPLALEPGAHRGGLGPGGTGAVVAPLRPLHAPGGDRR